MWLYPQSRKNCSEDFPKTSKASSQMSLLTVDISLEGVDGDSLNSYLSIWPHFPISYKEFCPNWMWSQGLRQGLYYIAWGILREGDSIYKAIGCRHPCRCRPLGSPVLCKPSKVLVPLGKLVESDFGSSWDLRSYLYVGIASPHFYTQGGNLVLRNVRSNQTVELGQTEDLTVFSRPLKY